MSPVILEDGDALGLRDVRNVMATNSSGLPAIEDAPCSYARLRLDAKQS